MTHVGLLVNFFTFGTLSPSDRAAVTRLFFSHASITSAPDTTRIYSCLIDLADPHNHHPPTSSITHIPAPSSPRYTLEPFALSATSLRLSAHPCYRPPITILIGAPDYAHRPPTSYATTSDTSTEARCQLSPRLNSSNSV